MFSGGDTIFATSGTISIDAITATTVSGDVDVVAFPGEYVKGHFVATICP
jgi:hypothetical protein